MNTRLLAVLLTVVLPAGAWAQAAKPAASARPTVSAKPASVAPAAGRNRLAPTALKAVEEVTPIDDDPSIQLTEAEVELAARVHTGDMACELGARVLVTKARREGFFLVRTKGHRFLMHPVVSRTGAIRLEDGRRGAMWLQLGNKSMLMSQKLGQRLADECQSPEQVVYAEHLRRNPVPSLLDPAPAPVAVTAPVTAPVAAPALDLSPATDPAAASAAVTQDGRCAPDRGRC